MKKYTAKFFRDSLPEWKRKRDPFMVRFLYRPISFYIASFCANRNVQANDVSNFSTVIGLIVCILLFIPNFYTGIIGGVLLNIWIILDCTDGNLARNVRKQAYGEFFDAMSSYLLIGFLFVALGYRSFEQHYILPIDGELYIAIGAFASICGVLMSLLYQKFILVSKDLGLNEKLSYDGSNSNAIMKFKTKIDMNLSVGGFLPILVLFGSIYNYLELIVVVWAAYYGLEFIATAFYFVIKATRYAKN